MKIRLLGNRILVKKTEFQPVTGVIIPAAPIGVYVGDVVAAGPGQPENGVMVENNVRVGDRVVFQQATGLPVWLAGDTYLLMRSPEVVGILDEEATPGIVDEKTKVTT